MTIGVRHIRATSPQQNIGWGVSMQVYKPLEDIPGTIAGNQMWLRSDSNLFIDAAKTTPSTANLDLIGAWGDKSGNGNDVTQSTSSKKPRRTDNQLNSKTVIRWDGVDDLLATVATVVEGFTQYSIFFVGLAADATNFARVISDEGSGGGNRVFNVILDQSSPRKITQTMDMTGGNFSISESVSSLEVYHAYEFNLSIANGGTVLIFVDGANVATSTTNRGILKSGISAAFVLGATVAGALVSRMDLAELIIYNVNLSAGDRTSIETYLTDRYNITFS